MYYSHVTDVAVLHVAAALDPDVKDQRIQVLAGSFNWDNCLDILRKVYPDHKFVDNFQPENSTLSYKVENDIAPGLVKKWAGRDWISLETCVKETVQGIIDLKLKK